jgi:2-amino-4-hydroxy-6-hydroxymethyldihydropteridine diphosphokinase
VTLAYIGLGANLGDREETIRTAVSLLGERGGVTVVAMSPLRDTAPVGYEDQPRFVNGVVAVDTSLTPGALLNELLAVERVLGRRRDGPRFGPRTIDLDLLLYDDVAVDEEGLTVPHPRLHERSFVLEPLAELGPGLIVPGKGRVDALLDALHSRA